MTGSSVTKIFIPAGLIGTADICGTDSAVDWMLDITTTKSRLKSEAAGLL